MKTILSIYIYEVFQNFNKLAAHYIYYSNSCQGLRSRNLDFITNTVNLDFNTIKNRERKTKIKY